MRPRLWESRPTQVEICCSGSSVLFSPCTLNMDFRGNTGNLAYTTPPLPRPPHTREVRKYYKGSFSRQLNFVKTKTSSTK